MTRTNWMAGVIRGLARACLAACIGVALCLVPAGLAVAQDLDEGADVEQAVEPHLGDWPDWPDWPDWGDWGAKTLDAIVWRPAGAAASLAGVGFFLASTPFLAPRGAEGIDESWDLFVRAPVERTFERRLGDL